MRTSIPPLPSVKSTAFLVAFSLAAATGPAQTARRAPAELLPAATGAGVSFAGLARCRQATEALHLAGLARALVEGGGTGTVAGKVEAALAMGIAEPLRRALGRLSLDPAAVRALLQGPLAAGVGLRPTYVGESMFPSLVLVVDARGREEAARAVAGRLAQVAAGRLQTDWEALEGVDEGGTLRQGPEDPPLLWALADGYLLAGLGRGYFLECLAVLGRRGPALAQEPEVREAARRLPRSPLLAVSLRLGEILGPLGRFFPYELVEGAAALGVSSLGGIHLGASTVPGGARDALVLHVEGGEEGLLRALAGRPATLALAGYCPAETVFLAAWSVDAASAVDALGRAVAAMPPAVRRGLDQAGLLPLRHALARAGVETAELRELAERLGPEWTAAATMPGERGLLPQVLLQAQVRGEARHAERLLVDLLERLGAPERRTTTHRGTTVHYFPVRGDGPFLSPSFALHEGRLVAGLELRTVREALSREPGGPGTLTADPRFLEAVERAGPAAVLAHARISRAAGQVWRLLYPLAESFVAGRPELGLDIEAVPAPEELAGALGDGTASALADEWGLVFRQEHPLGVGVFVALAGFVLDRALERSAAGAR